MKTILSHYEAILALQLSEKATRLSKQASRLERQSFPHRDPAVAAKAAKLRQQAEAAQKKFEAMVN